MHLIQALASGVNGAANGTANIVARGTATPASYYLDFEATQLFTGTITLDANGGAVVYVNQLVDVTVLDVNGVQLREFVAGDAAPGVEVISRSFTGVDYTDGSSGTSKPTTLQTVLDAWLTSAGSPDFKVAVGGTPTLLSAAVAGLSGLFFNVKSYGAIGDGVADDGAAISAAIAAAAATVNVGGIVFFPPGLYRSTTNLSVPVGVSLMGCGCTSTKVLVDNPALPSLMLFNGADTAGSRLVQGIWFGALSNFNPPLVIVGPLASCVDFVGCSFGGDIFTKGQHLNVQAAGQGSRVTVTRCGFSQGANAPILTQSGTGRIVIRDSDFVVTLVGAYGQQVVGVTDGVSVHDCRFDASAVTGGTITYIGFAPATWDGCLFTGNRFKGNVSAIPIALFNSLATPNFDCQEYQNFFGDSASSAITPYGYTTDGYADQVNGSGVFRAHGSRIGRVAQYITNVNQQVDAKQYGTVCIRRSTNAAGQNISATKGSLGDRLVVVLMNESGGNALINFTSPDFSCNGATSAFTVNTSTRSYFEFEFLAVQPSGTAGQWVQISGQSTGVV